MIDLRLIGIGTGDPDQLTRAAERAMREADLVLLPRKRAEVAQLLDVRRRLCAAVGVAHRGVEFAVPERAKDRPYNQAVEEWHRAIATAWTETIAAHLPHGGQVALLVWGDPSLYDSSLRIAEQLRAGGLAIRTAVVPGVGSLQALAAAHAVPFNTLAGSVLVTTGRRLAEEGWPASADTVAVLLDGVQAFAGLDPAGVEIWWGAYLGMEQQALVAGPLVQRSAEIVALRAALRAEHGWIMDCYLLRRILRR